MKVTKKEVKKEEKEKFNLEECAVLWLQESKEGKKYLTGKLPTGEKIIGFYNNRVNDKQPIFRIFATDEEGKTADEIITLWESISKTDKYYLSGVTNEEEAVIGFYGNEKEPKKPYVMVYYKDENK